MKNHAKLYLLETHRNCVITIELPGWHHILPLLSIDFLQESVPVSSSVLNPLSTECGSFERALKNVCDYISVILSSLAFTFNFSYLVYEVTVRQKQAWTRSNSRQSILQLPVGVNL